jgi:hypothetical protein
MGKTRKHLVNQGLCWDCGNPKQEDSHKCNSCLEKHKNRARALVEKRKAARLCTRCGATKNNSADRCDNCLEKLRAAYHARRRRYTANNKCRKCGAQCQGDRVRCNNCNMKGNDKRRELKQGRLALNLCIRCGFEKELDYRKLCVSCQDSQMTVDASNKIDRASKGLCRECTLRADWGIYCLRHWIARKTAASQLNHWKRTGKRPDSPMRAKDALELWRTQDGRCAFTGTKLAATNGSLDHKIPVVSGGDCDISNYHWTCQIINSMKGTMTPDEFVSVCRVVVDYADGKITEPTGAAAAILSRTVWVGRVKKSKSSADPQP